MREAQKAGNREGLLELYLYLMEEYQKWYDGIASADGIVRYL